MSVAYICTIWAHVQEVGYSVFRSLTYALAAGFLTEPGAQLVVSHPYDLPVSIPPPEWCYKPVTHPALLHMSGSEVSSPCMSSQHFYPLSYPSIPTASFPASSSRLLWWIERDLGTFFRWPCSSQVPLPGLLLQCYQKLGVISERKLSQVLP